VWDAPDVPAEVSRAIKDEDILNIAGGYGDRYAGDPIEYDHLKIVLTDDTVEVEFFNRGITLFTADDERFRRIHRVMCKLLDAKGIRTIGPAPPKGHNMGSNKIGRNAPCPCGSGKKYKKCCLYGPYGTA